jgi:cell division septal protein FtsQ
LRIRKLRRELRRAKREREALRPIFILLFFVFLVLLAILLVLLALLLRISRYDSATVFSFHSLQPEERVRAALSHQDDKSHFSTIYVSGAGTVSFWDSVKWDGQGSRVQLIGVTSTKTHHDTNIF